MIKEEKYKNIIQSLFKVTNQLKQLEKMPPIQVSNGKYLYHSEIMTMYIIKSHPESNVTEIAAHLGVTTGAVSQVISKLEKKQMIEKYKIFNQKEVTLILTEVGNKVIEKYIEENCKRNCKLTTLLEKFNIQQLDFIQDLFKDFEDILND